MSQAYTSGAFWQGFGAFFDPIVAEFGWSRAITAGAVSLQRTESGMISPFVGFFIENLQGNDVVGRIVPMTGLVRGGIPVPTDAFLRAIRLVQ